MFIVVLIWFTFLLMNQVHIWSDISFAILLKWSDYTCMHVAFTCRTQMKIRTLSCGLPFDCFSLPLLFQGFCPPLAYVSPPFQWWLLWAHQSEPCQMVSYRQLTATTGEHSVLPRSEGHKVIITTESSSKWMCNVVPTLACKGHCFFVFGQEWRHFLLSQYLSSSRCINGTIKFNAVCSILTLRPVFIIT